MFPEQRKSLPSLEWFSDFFDEWAVAEHSVGPSKKFALSLTRQGRQQRKYCCFEADTGEICLHAGANQKNRHLLTIKMNWRMSTNSLSRNYPAPYWKENNTTRKVLFELLCGAEMRHCYNGGKEWLYHASLRCTLIESYDHKGFARRACTHLLQAQVLSSSSRSSGNEIRSGGFRFRQTVLVTKMHQLP